MAACIEISVSMLFRIGKETARSPVMVAHTTVVATIGGKRDILRLLEGRIKKELVVIHILMD